MKFVTISDTHGKHNKLLLPKGDVLIHAGDVSMMGKESEIEDFMNWFKAQDFKYKIMVAGNHDFLFERAPQYLIEKIIPENIIYLNDSRVTIDEIKIWGSPVTPWFFNWAFNRHRGEEINKHWKLIRSGTDIVITHGPVFGILDKTQTGEHVGCKDLLNKVNEIKPKVYIGGHIHEGYGIIKKAGSTFINVSVVNVKYEVANKPVVFNGNDRFCCRYWCCA
ncbi:MAG: metallophosphatase domain-containing protein [Agriterribacter sp.]